jgi:membrane protein
MCLVKHEGFELSGYIAFTALLALFPFLIFLTALAGFLGDAASADRVISTLFELAPPEVAQVLAPILRDVLTQQHGGLLTLSIVFALWTASSGVEALRTLLNRCYEVSETRAFWQTRPVSIVIVVGGAGLALVLSLALVLGPVIWKVATDFMPLSDAWFLPWIAIRYGIAAVLVSGCLVGLHRILPNCHQPMRRVWPGAAMTALLWLASAALFSLYVDNFASYSVTYGSLGGVIMTLMFFYFSAVIFGFGAELNAALARLSRGRRPPGPELAQRHERGDAEDCEAGRRHQHGQHGALGQPPDLGHQVLAPETAEIADRVDRGEAGGGARAGKEARRHGPEAGIEQLNTGRAQHERHKAQTVRRQLRAGDEADDPGDRDCHDGLQHHVVALQAPGQPGEHAGRERPRDDVE